MKSANSRHVTGGLLVLTQKASTPFAEDSDRATWILQAGDTIWMPEGRRGYSVSLCNPPTRRSSKPACIIRPERKPQQPVVKLQLHSAGDASPLTALLLPQIFPILHPTVHKTHGGGPALRSSRHSAGVPTARTVRRGVEHRGASPPSVLRWTFTTGCLRHT